MVKREKSNVYRLIAVLLSLLMTFTGVIPYYIPSAYGKEGVSAAATNTSMLLELLHAAEKSQVMQTDLTTDKDMSIASVEDKVTESPDDIDLLPIVNINSGMGNEILDETKSSIPAVPEDSTQIELEQNLSPATNDNLDNQMPPVETESNNDLIIDGDFNITTGSALRMGGLNRPSLSLDRVRKMTTGAGISIGPGQIGQLPGRSDDGTYPIRNRGGRHNIGFKAQSGLDLLRFSQGNASLWMSPLNSAAVTGKIQKNTILYKEIYPNIDLRYTVDDYRLKEDIIVNEFTGLQDFYFQLNLKNADYQIMDNGTINFLEQGTKNQIFYMDKPFVLDKEGNRCDAADLLLTKEGILKLTIDPNWLENAVYPIVIDPTIYLAGNEVYQASLGFSNVQGQNNWYYEELEYDGDINPLIWDDTNKRWRAKTSLRHIITSNSQHPSSTDCVRTWKAPHSGTIRISGNVSHNSEDSNGVILKILKNRSRIWPTTTNVIGVKNSSVGVNIIVSVNAGELIRFVVNHNPHDMDNDLTYWDPVITYINNLTSTPTFTRSSVAYKRNGAQVAENTPRYETGKYGQALMLEEGTTNHLTVNQSNVETDISGIYTGNTGTTLNLDTSTAWQGSASVKAVCDGTVGYQGVAVTYNAPADTTITGSVYVKGNGKVALSMNKEAMGDVLITGAFVTLNPNTWTRISITDKTNSTGGRLIFGVTTGNQAQAVTFWADGLQLEQKPYATSWTLGGTTRADETLTIPTAGVISADQGTIEVSAYIDPTGVHSAGNPKMSVVFAMADIQEAQNRNQISIRRIPNSTSWRVWFANADGSAANINLGNITTAGWHRFGVTWKVGEGGYAYLNGVYKGNVTANYLPTGISEPVAYIGSWPTCSYTHDQLIDDLRISSRLRTEAEILAAYQANQPLPVDQYTTCKMNLDNNLDLKSVIESAPEAVKFTRSSDAYKKDGTKVFEDVSRYETGKYGQALMIEEGTTNLLTANQSSAETDLTGWSGYGSPGLSRVIGGWNGNYGVKCDLKAGDCWVGFTGAPYTAGSTYTLSVYAKGTPGRQISLRYSDGISSGGSPNFTLTGVWQRFSYTFAVSSTATTLNTFIRDAAGTAQTFYLDGCQVENIAYATSWNLGGTPRANETMTIATAGVIYANEGSIEVSAYIDPTGVHSESNPNASVIFAMLNNLAQNQISIRRISKSTSWRVFFANADGSAANINLGNITTAGWYSFGVTWKAGVGGYAYLNGVYKGSVAADFLPSAVTEPHAYIGYWVNGLYRHNQLIDDLRISSRMRTESEILAAYQSNAPLPVDKDTTCKLDFGDDSQPIVSELNHFGEKEVNLSGNFSRTYTDMTMKTSGFNLDITRTYNSRDDRVGGPLGKGWSFGLQGSISYYLPDQKIIRLPDGSALTFTQNPDNTYTANDSRNTLVRQADKTYILTTKDQYTYGFDAAGRLKWMRDRNGNTITLTVNSSDKVTSVTDQTGRQINITYNGPQGYLDSITDPLGRTVQYKYDSNYRLIQVIDPMGKIMNYAYDSDGYLSEIRDHDNNLMESMKYDSSAGKTNVRVSWIKDAFENTTIYTYDTDYRKVTANDINGRQTVTWYDSSLYPVQVRYSDGRISTNVYSLDADHVNKFGELESFTDQNGNETVYLRDSKGNIIQTINPDLSYKQYAYDNKNNLLREKDENGKYIFYVYDTIGINLLKKAQPLNGTDQYTAGCDEAKFAVTNYTYLTASEAQQLFNCNIAGLLQSEKDPNGHVTTYTYDTYGNTKTVTDPENKTTTYNYNNIGWQTSVVSPKGYTTSYVYDKNGNIIKTTLHGGEVTRTTHDNMGRQTKVIAANLYNPNLDNLTNDTYSGDQGTRYTYYPSGKVKTQTDVAGNTTSFTYDLYGNVLTETRPNGSSIQYTYDNLNRLTMVKFKDNSAATPVLLESISYLVLANGNTQKTETGYLNSTEKAITTYTYDYIGRLIREDNPDGTNKTTSFNTNGTVNYTTDERGYSTYFRYDGLNRNAEQWVPTATDGSGKTLYTYINTAYDKAGNILSVKTGKTAVSIYQVPTNFITQTKTYYNNNKLKSETDSAGRRTDYFYDNDGNLSQKDVYTSATTKNVTEYVSNYFGKPVTEKLHVRQGDLFGNSFASNTDIVLTTTNTFDKNGNSLTVTRPDNVVITYTYDNLDRQTKMSMPGKDENGNPVTITSSTTYDWAGKVLTQTDANNHTITYSYDQRERLVKVTDVLGHSAANYYDLAGRLIAEVTPNNYDSNKTLTQMSRTEYTYDTMDRVKTKGYTYLNPISGQWETFVAKAYKYDANGNMLKELDALGYEAGTGTTVDNKINSGYGTQYTYDLANRVLTVLDPVNKDRGLLYTTQYSYDGAGRKLSETNANGVITSYSYDDANNLLSTKVNNQTVKTNTYDTVGNPITQTDGNGNAITLSYNAWNKPKQAVYPGDATIPASTVTYQYDATGNLKQTTNSAGPVDLYTYDNQGRELSHTQRKADGTQSITTSIRYDKVGNKRFLVDGNNVTTENTYNEINKLTSSKLTVTNANGVPVLHVTRYGYDADGNQTSQTDWLGNTYTNTYDPLDRIIEKKDPLNKSIEKLEYNHNSVQIRSTDALNKVTQYTYDKNNRLLSTIDPLNHAKSKTYDNVGNVRTTTDGRGKVTTNHYDPFNRLTSVVNAKNETTSYTYDLNGNTLTQTDGANHTTTYEYNAANKLKRKIDHGGRTGTYPNYTYALAKTESYTYDANGKLLTKLDRSGNTTTSTYDVHGRMLSQTNGTQTVGYTYDGNGNQLTMTDSTGTTTRNYDELNRTKSKSVPGVTGTMIFLYDITNGLPTGQVAETDNDQKGNVTTKVFDQAGRMISVTASGNTTTYTYYDNGSKHTVIYPDGSSEEYTYYDDGLLHMLVNKKADQTVIESYTYTYDAAHNQTSKVDAKGTTTYTYDDLNRLESVTEPSGKVTIYTFDAAGNRSTQTETIGTTNTVTSYTYNEQNRLTNTLTEQNNVITQTVAYTYDSNGNQITVTKVPYVEGIPQIAQLTTSTFDKFNQLTVTTTPEGTSITNTYNGEGLRVVKQVDSQITIYIYEGDKVILELDGTGNQIARNVRGTNLISRTVDGTTLYYVYNGHADVTALIDAAGTIQATYYYDAFGNIMESTGNVNNPFTYAGYQYDKESNYYYLNSRFYDPVTARFLSEDTYTGDKNDPLSLNLYTYCHNEPLMYSDPTGHSWLSTAISVGKSIIKAIGAANKDKKGKSHSSSKGSSGGLLSTVVNTIGSMIFGNAQSSRNNSVQRPTPSTLILKLASNINHISNQNLSIANYYTQGTGKAGTIDLNGLIASTDPTFGLYEYKDPSGLGYTSAELMETFKNMNENNWIYTLHTSDGRTVFSREGNKDVQGLAVDHIKWLLDELVPDNEAVYYTDKLSIMNEEIWGVEGDKTIGPKTFENLVYYKEHTKNARPSSKNKHQEGQTRRQLDSGGEKGDARRKPNPNKRKQPNYIVPEPGVITDDAGNKIPLTLFPINPATPTSVPIRIPIRIPIFGW